MYIKTCIGASIALLSSITITSAQSDSHHIIDSNARPTVFAPGVVSSPFEEVAATFTPDGNTVYFAQGTIAMEICYSTRAGGKAGGEWGKPRVASFSGRWGDWDPFLSPDGRQVYFVSNRPLDTTGEKKLIRNTHLWYADRLDGNGWSEPRYIKDSFNMDGIGNYGPTVSRTKDLFFYSPQRDKAGKGKSYYVKWLGDHYGEPQALFLNGDEEISDPYIAPDEGYIIFVSGNDLYISFRKGDSWGTGQKLGPQVNDGSPIYDPTVSPDGRMLYFTSTRVMGYYKRDPKSLPMDYDGLSKEMNGIFNGRGNIFMIPIHLPVTGS
jgi:Tol biopolymer transport system component